MLQFTALNKGFGSESPHLVCLNKFISQAHASFKQYFKDICDVQEPSEVFNIDQYSDLCHITKPMIVISADEVVEMHRILLEHANTISPSPTDPLHELLHDLGDVSSVQELMGQNQARHEITLILSSKHEGVVDGDGGMEGVWVRTKQLVVDILRCQRTGDNLEAILNTVVTEKDHTAHQILLQVCCSLYICLFC